MTFDAIDRQFRKPVPIRLECLRCETPDGVEMVPAMTAYHFKGEIGSPDDPNKPIPLCGACGDDHREYWNGMWADYHAGLL